MTVLLTPPKRPTEVLPQGTAVARHLIVIPAYNEQEALQQTIADLQTLPDHYDILLIDDGSRDGTAELARRLQKASRLPLHLLHLPMNCGIGVAVQAGYLFAAQRGSYHYVIQFDADGQHDAVHIPALVRECQEKNLDLCIGSRFLESTTSTGSSSLTAHSPLTTHSSPLQSTFARQIGIRFFAWLISTLSGVRVTDPTSGFRCAGPRGWKRFALHYPEDYPEPESLFWCARNRLRIGEVPVRMRPRQGGVSSIRPVDSAYYMIKVSLAICLDRMRARERPT
ncbi:MAG TPA: glycosyltransferase family 2 protein [Gemmataceae bacterium]|jgi:glycosyltransferase involved in cell wall biosynthesis|nr:glycosyltransferase family 2 protein [Gemmataceae bacterium]